MALVSVRLLLFRTAWIALICAMRVAYIGRERERERREGGKGWGPRRQ